MAFKGFYQWWARYDNNRLSMRGQSQHNSHGHVVGGRRTLRLRRRNGGPKMEVQAQHSEALEVIVITLLRRLRSYFRFI